MNRDQGQAIKDAHTRLSQLPDWSGAVIVLFTRDFSLAQVSTTIPQHLTREVLKSLAAMSAPPALIVPNDRSAPRGGNGSG